MERTDFRSIGREAQEALRKRAVHLVLDEGMTQGEAARVAGVHRQVVNWWVQRHQDAGAEGLLDGRRVSPRRGRGILTASEARRIQRWITNKCPDQMQLPFALWTAQAVRELIRRKLGKELGLSTMHLYLNRWGFTAQKPLTRATQRDPQRIEAWLRKVYPSIAARAKRETAMIYWSDETGVCNQDQIGRGYAPKGQTPILTQTGQKFSTSMIADFPRFHEASYQGRETKGLPYRRQSARPPCEEGEAMAGAARGRDRDLLSPGLCAGT
jgi:transposase